MISVVQSLNLNGRYPPEGVFAKIISVLLYWFDVNVELPQLDCVQVVQVNFDEVLFELENQLVGDS